MQDAFGREIDYARLSLTDACNLRCVYCMPEDMTFLDSKELLQVEEWKRIIRVLDGLGFKKFRFTGGEPTLHPKLIELVRYAAELPSAPFVAMTTNGLRLKHLAASLKEAGLQRVNLSLDSLNPERFELLARRGSLSQVLDGLKAAEEVGLEVKINALLIREFNEADWCDLAAMSLDAPRQVRFLEMMPFAEQTEIQRKLYLTRKDVQAVLEERFGALELVGEGLDGEARMFRISGAKGTVGFISPVSEPFCADCNRLRVTADGYLRLCLLKEMEVYLKGPMREGVSDAELEARMAEGIRQKPWGHDLAHQNFALNRGMSQIGG